MKRRGEAEMLRLVLDFARENERVRVVAMNGSRLNANAPVDSWQDYDIVYAVTDLAPFLENRAWIDHFGEWVMLQTPGDMGLYPPGGEEWFTFLMQFTDGNRIDLKLLPLAGLQEYLAEDSLTQILLDKDGRCPPLPPPTDATWHVQPPTAALFDDSCNEFWWLAPYVAKGIARGEVLYAAFHLNLMRDEVLRMLAWRQGYREGFNFSPGKCSKYLPGYLDETENAALLQSLQCGGVAECRAALAACISLFRPASREVAGTLGVPYPLYDERVSAFLG